MRENDQEYKKLLIRYNQGQRTIKSLGDRLTKLTSENQFIKNEKKMWGVEKIQQQKILQVQINRFNKKISQLQNEIMSLREKIKELETVVSVD